MKRSGVSGGGSGGVTGKGSTPGGTATPIAAGVKGTVATEPRRRGLRLGAAFGCTATPRACPRELLGALLAGRDLFFGGMVLQGFTFVVLEPQMAVDDDVSRALASVFPK